MSCKEIGLQENEAKTKLLCKGAARSRKAVEEGAARFLSDSSGFLGLILSARPRVWLGLRLRTDFRRLNVERLNLPLRTFLEDPAPSLAMGCDQKSLLGRFGSSMSALLP